VQKTGCSPCFGVFIL